MRINQAKNDKELKQMLELPLRYGIEIFMDKILELNKDAINKIVYYSVGTPEYYQSLAEQPGNEGFIDAWDTAVHSTKAVRNADIEGALYYKPSNMWACPPQESNNYMGQHFGVGETQNSFYGDSREYLAEILYEGIKGKKIFGNGDWTKPRNAFDELVKVLGKAKFKKLLTESLKEAGLDIKSHSTPIKRTGFDYDGK